MKEIDKQNLTERLSESGDLSESSNVSTKVKIPNCRMCTKHYATNGPYDYVVVAGHIRPTVGN